MEMRIARAGLFTTVQDLGRPALRHAGVPLGGAMDRFAARVANLLVGNDEGAAVLEVTLGGLEAIFPEGGVVAVTGAEYESAAGWKPIGVPAGGSLKLGACKKGFRGYIAVRGGVAVPQVLGSRSTYLRGSWGGWEGRRLQDGTELAIGEHGPVPADKVPAISASWTMFPAYSSAATVRAVAGAHSDWFGDAFPGSTFQVGNQSDRMGLRLTGATLVVKGVKELSSIGAAPGTVQVPPDGHPIVLGADAQTVGGYPQAAHVVQADQPIIAQLRPGDRVKFKLITLAEAQWLMLRQERDLHVFRAGIRSRWERVTA